MHGAVSKVNLPALSALQQKTLMNAAFINDEVLPKL
jgi:hypothetical protein